MKKIKLLSALIVLITAFGIVGCDSEPVDPVLLDYDPNEEVDPEVGLFKVKIDGETYTADNTVAVIAEGTITIVGSKQSGAFVSILIGNTEPGTYFDGLMTYNPSSDTDFGYWNYDNEGESSGSVTNYFYR